MNDLADDELLDSGDLARIKRTTVAAVYSARSRGLLPPARRVGRRLLWRRSEVEQWLDAQVEDVARS